MRIVLWGTYDSSKPRVRILREGLRAIGVEVIECHVAIWQGVDDKSQITSVAAWALLLWRVLVAYPRLVWRYLQTPQHDLVLLGYPGIIDLFVLRPLAWARGVPILLDWYISAYDTLVLDRRRVMPDGLVARAIWAVEWLALRVADGVFLDTRTHARRMERMFHVPTGSIGSVWVGAETRAFRRSSISPVKSDPCESDGLRVLFYGQFIPLHGIEHIIGAARLLRDAPVDWTLIGRGQEAGRIRRLLEEQPLPRLHWIDWVSYEQLADQIAGADLCLGIFGTSEKAASVIPNKVYQAVATGRPIVTRDAPAIREWIGEPSRCAELVPAGNPAALAEVIRRCAVDRHACPGRGCHHELRKGIAPPAIARQFMSMLPRVGRGRVKQIGALCSGMR